MIDITSIQTFPVAPALSALQSTNADLVKSSKNLKTLLAIVVVLGGVYIGYRFIKKRNEDKSK